MRVSIIVPALNEAAGCGHTAQPAKQLEGGQKRD